MFNRARRIEGKTKEEKLSFLSSLTYDVQLKQKGNQFYLMIPELALVVVDENLDMAYKKLDAQKQEYFEKNLDCESDEAIVFPTKVSRKSEASLQLKIFVLKIIIVCVLAGTTISISGALVINKLSHFSAVEVINKVARAVLLQIDRFANKPEEQKQEALGTIRKAFEGLRPVADEYHAVFSQPNEEENKRLRLKRR